MIMGSGVAPGFAAVGEKVQCASPSVPDIQHDLDPARAATQPRGRCVRAI